MIFIETQVFTEDLPHHLDEEEYREFQCYLASDPETGDVIQGTGGLRKIRWSARGKGKRGGVRIIYYYICKRGQIRLLLIYRKGIKDDLDARERRILCDLNKRWT